MKPPKAAFFVNEISYRVLVEYFSPDTELVTKGLNPNLLKDRIQRGMNIEIALTANFIKVVLCSSFPNFSTS
jgi:hypothetical protein